MINIDNLSEISYKESMNRLSLGTMMTHSNNYKILLMNVRNVFEKKNLFTLI
jgi:hypothetical protein